MNIRQWGNSFQFRNILAARKERKAGQGFERILLRPRHALSLDYPGGGEKIRAPFVRPVYPASPNSGMEIAHMERVMK